MAVGIVIRREFSHVVHWVFDLDNTLYPTSARLFDQIELRMTRFVMEALDVDHATADGLRDVYWRRYGTTLAGLMQEHGVDPGPYLETVHDISLAHLEADPRLRSHIEALPGRKIVYTNGPRIHAERVTEARGLKGAFDAIYGVEHAAFHPKPERIAYETVFALDGLDPARAAMFEDDPRNLMEPARMGLRCVLVGDEAMAPADHIHHRTRDLAHFLAQVSG